MSTAEDAAFMDSALKELTTIRVPDEDPAIAQTFVDLDDRIDEWSQAASRACEVLERYDERGASESQEADAAATDQPDSDVSVELGTAVAESDAAADDQQHPTEPRAAADESGSNVLTLPGRKPRVAPDTRSGTDKRSESQPKLRPDVDQSEAPTGPSPDETEAAAPVKDAAPIVECDADEELLASLDEATARAIRIRRRLCRDKKSVQELLKEMKPATRTEAKKAKSLRRPFRRGQGR